MVPASQQACLIGVEVEHAEFVRIVRKDVGQDSGDGAAGHFNARIVFARQQQVPAFRAEPGARLDPLDGTPIVEVEMQPEAMPGWLQRIERAKIEGDGWSLRLKLKAADQSPVIMQFDAHFDDSILSQAY